MTWKMDSQNKKVDHIVVQVSCVCGKIKRSVRRPLNTDENPKIKVWCAECYPIQHDR